IEGSAPGSAEVAILPEPARTADNLTATVTREAEDPDGGDGASAFTSLGRPLFNYQYANRQERGEHTVTKVGKFTYDKKQKRWELPINTRSEDWFRGENLVEKAKLVIYWNAGSRAFAME
ncbi:MAG: hypothetical protein QF464_21715, partial [Myxococcota bacterium]|nr:hypothetical protein [Myxococcota bacterium]